jgi:hypothetical protein
MSQNMSVPERADKWIVFGVLFAIGAADLFSSTGIELTLNRRHRSAGARDHPHGRDAGERKIAAFCPSP